MMTQEKALEIVNKVLIGLQRVRSMSVEELTAMGWQEEIVRSVIGDLVPWMQGDRGDAFLNALTMVSDRKHVTGGELYNFMTILHTLDRTLLMMISAVTETMFPKPDMQWFRDLGVDGQI